MKHPNPRKDDTFSKSFAGVMDQIGEMDIQESLWVDIVKNQKDEIRLKIIVWAKDRISRKEEYHRFAKSYVNEPLTQDDLVLIWQAKHPGEKIPEERRTSLINDRYVDPCRVPKEMLIENNRAMFEYHFYAPFSRSGNVSDYRVDAVKPILLSALYQLGDKEKSQALLADCIANGLKAEAIIGKEFKRDHIFNAVYMFTSNPENESFQIIAKHWENQLFRELAAEQLNYFSKQYYDTDTYEKSKKIFDEWQTLAAKDWKNPLEKAFAEWLKKQTPPPLPPKPKHSK
jgi:hypothetical protein